MVLAGLAASASAIGVLASCLDDPREGEQVTVIDKCDTTRLSTDPASGQATLRAYLEVADSLVKQSTAAEAALKDACNKINQELGIPTGDDAARACSQISARLQTILKNEPPAPPGAFTVTHFVEIFYPSTCVATPGVLEACLSSCAGPCDLTTKCEQGKLAGVCNGECLGSCEETGDNIGCNGTCAGETLNIDNAPCAGECVGTCAAPVWTGACTASCPRGFNGFCEGTCTGSCIVGTDNFCVGDAGAGAVPPGCTPVVPPSDAGAEAGIPVAPPVTQPPGGGDGNCKGKCIGVCSKGANGSCAASCLTFEPGAPVGNFSAGFCGAAGGSLACTGTCRSTQNGASGPCRGTCTQLNKPQCTGICRTTATGGCNGTYTNAICEGEVACGQNVQCNNACQAKARLAATCSEPVAGSYILATDKPLYDALTKYAGPLGKAVNDLAQIRAALAFVSKTELGDFKREPLNLSGDLLRVCAEEGRKNVLAADAIITAAGNANPIVYRKQ